MPNIKILVSEIEGTELEYSTEYDLLSALNFIGFTGSQRFSRKTIPIGETVTVPEGDEMVLTTYMDVLGNIDILGEVTIL
jgi:hypothetical protein